MSLRASIIIACCVGFVSISMEVLWINVIGYLLKSHAGIFAIVLSFVLFGVAFGAKYGYQKNKLEQKDIIKLISDSLLLAGIINFLGLPIIGWLMTIHEFFGVLLIGKIIVVSFLLGCIFPLLCHISITNHEKSVGQHTSWIYAGNIVGATTGPLITGFILIDHFDMQSIITGLCIISIFLSLIIRINNKSSYNIKHIITRVLVGLLVLLIYKPLYSNNLELIHFRSDYKQDLKFKYVTQNKSGIISVQEDEKGDIFFGGGAYDGRINSDPENNSNGIHRAYMVAALHKNPENVLMIGLSTGSWAKVLQDFPDIKQLTIIEINSKYLELISKYPENATILNDKRIKIIIDDGRRWINRNLDRKFDMIVMNTTYHFREHITNLLSIEFLKICKRVLNKDGVMYWNTTRSSDVVFTAAHAFKYITTYGSFVAGSDAPFTMSTEEKKNAFLKFERDNEKIFTKNEVRKELLDKFVNTSLVDIRDSILSQNLWLVTDNNIATEYKAGVWRKSKN